MIILDHVQGSPEWHAARRGIPTASEFGRIITPTVNGTWPPKPPPKKPRKEPLKPKPILASAAELYIADLIDEIARPDAERGFTGNRHTIRGTELEPEARDWYGLIAEGEVRQVGLCLTDDRLAGCSPDALVGEGGGLEIKAPDGPTHVRYLRAGVLPDDYRAQVHGSLVVTGRLWWDFVSWCPPYRPLLVRVYRDGYTELVEQALEAFLTEFDAARAAVLGEAA